MTTIEMIRKKLLEALAPSQLEIIDDSNKHIGHPGNTGGGHYTVIIASEAFNGKNLIACHRLVNQAVAGMIPKQIHALSIKIRK